jgi:hypothetical protein
MRLRYPTFLLVTLSLAPALAAQIPNDSVAVRTVVESYLHGLKFNDVPSLKRAFWPEARLYWAKRDGTLGQLTQTDWYTGFEKSAGKEEAGDLRIASLEITQSIASVKVVEDYATSRYTDYLSLVRFNGEWRIVNKIYAAERRAGPSGAP